MTDLQNLSFPPEYYCDEVREGFFVSETMKRFWAAQLVVLAEIDKICGRHDLNWYAESGTLLGTVRHKGFIPWDDDLDIVMFRDEYEKFVTCARKELPEGYLLFSSDDPKHEFTFGRVDNGNEINYSDEHLRVFHGCPYLVGVDIFQLDKLYMDISREEDRMKRGAVILQTMYGIQEGILTKEEIKKNVEQIEEENSITIETEKVYKGLVDTFVNVAQEANGEDSNEIAIIKAWITRGRFMYNKSCYDKWIELPFESTSLRVPYKYTEVLECGYGKNYMEPVRGSAMHEYPLYRKQEERYRKEAGATPGKFCFQKERFEVKEEKKTFCGKLKEMISSLKSIHNNIQNIVEVHGIENAIPFLETCQSAAVAIGNTIEGKYGEDNVAVQALEAYCNDIYEASLGWNEDSERKLDECLRKVEEKVEELKESSPKEILFMLVKASWWGSIKDVYTSIISNEENNVSVIPVPYSYLDHTGRTLETVTDLDEFKKIPELNGKITSTSDYNIESKHPDVIVIQFPYDEYSRILAVPKQLYSRKLMDQTDELIFVPFLEPDPPLSTEDVAYEAMQEYVEQPAVFNADKVLIGSEKLREFFVKKLVDMTDENLTDYWNRRICLKENL